MPSLFLAVGAPGGSRLLEPKFHYSTPHEKSQLTFCTNLPHLKILNLANLPIEIASVM